MTRRIRIRKGLDLPLSGQPSSTVSHGNPVRQVALNGLDHLGLKPRVAVQLGDSVTPGDPLFVDRRDPTVHYTAPGQGRVSAIHRGARRVLESVVIDLDDSERSDARWPIHDRAAIASLDRSVLASQIQEAGLWTAFRTRPFSRVPQSDSVPRAIFVTALDTQPLAADPAPLVAASREAFLAGLTALGRLSGGKTWLCTAPGWPLSLPDLPGLEQVEFEGPHPAGLPGTHMHFLDPVGPDRTSWHIGWQDVIGLGELLLTGRLPTRRIVALSGPMVERPRLVETRIGAALGDLLDKELLTAPRRRVISGSVLHGRNAGGNNGFLGRYHDQVTVLEERGQRQFLGWKRLANRAFSVMGTWSRASGHRPRPFTTARHGRFSGMLPMRVFERLMPLDMLPSPLFRALLVMDTDQAQALGALELAEEDLALCTFACPAKTDYGGALRRNLDHIEKHG